MSPTDWISAMCSLLAAIVGLVTLLTVYVAAMQILSRREQYSLGVSAKALGRWEKKVVTPSLLKMKTRISTPTISVPKMVAKGFKPIITFPVGPSADATSTITDLEASLAEASWVNFLEAIGLQPENTNLYDMQSEPDLVNGIVPMRWKGRDLVAISSMLGFQSYEKKPSHQKPMPLPMQWSGPLGWLQFRASSDGCIVEFRRRRSLRDQLSGESHGYYNELKVEPKTRSLKERLWQSIGGLCLDSGDLLYLGGADKRQDNKPRSERTVEEIFAEIRALPEDNPPNEEIKRIMWGGKKNRPKAIKTESTPMSESQSVSDLLSAMSSGQIKSDDSKETMVHVLDPCPGLLSVIVEGELMYSRGLDYTTCCEYYRTMTDYDEVNKTTHPYRLGQLYMNEVLLKLMKQSVLLLQPDSFYLTSKGMFISDVSQIWKHVRDLSNNSQYKFPATSRPKPTPSYDDQICNEKLVLHHAMALCKEFQSIRVTGRAVFTINDMRILSIASTSLRAIIGPATDLIWAMIVSPQLFADLARRFAEIEVEEVLGVTVTSNKEHLDCASLTSGNPDLKEKYLVPLLGDGKFTGTQVLAAFLDVFLTFFWIDKGWISDVAQYDATMPQTVTMC